MKTKEEFSMSKFVDDLREDLIERLIDLSRIALNQNKDKGWHSAFDNKEELIDYVDDIIVHSKLVGKEEGYNQAIDEIRKRIKLCLKESKEMLNKLKMGSDTWIKERGEILGYKTSLECVNRVEGAKQLREKENE